MKALLLFLAASIALVSVRAAEPPKHLLIVTVTTGFRHSCIPTAERILTQLGQTSGAYTADFVRQPAPATPDAVKQALLPLAPDNLKHYDGVVFCCTTGDLPLPDKQGFLDWIKAGHAFIGIHAASDTFHSFPPYLQMLGGEFWKHGPQVGVSALNMDPGNPANAALPPAWPIKQEEIYNFKNYDPAKVHELLTLSVSPLDGTPGHFPVSWCHLYGNGRVFYTSLGHREDVWDDSPALPGRINPPEVAQKFQAHILGGIQWALGLKPGDATPQAK